MTNDPDSYIYTDEDWRRAAKDALSQRGWTQARLAGKVGSGLTQGMLSHLLSGRTNPSPYVAKICEILTLDIPEEHQWLVAGRTLHSNDRRLFGTVLAMVRAATEAAKREGAKAK